MTRRVRGLVALTAAAVILGAAAYRLLLTDEARASLRRSVREVRNTAQTLNETLGERQNDEEAVLSNQQRTEEMWSALGY